MKPPILKVLTQVRYVKIYQGISIFQIGITTGTVKFLTTLSNFFTNE
ncbi:MAG TPA: hypothetical protein VMT57_07775 [Candidatus Thermoplasmatota archaeon]|nr:hypothetical protein [Candidatus Thermoplasmatota archaeon]